MRLSPWCPACQATGGGCRGIDWHRCGPRNETCVSIRDQCIIGAHAKPCQDLERAFSLGTNPEIACPSHPQPGAGSAAARGQGLHLPPAAGHRHAPHPGGRARAFHGRGGPAQRGVPGHRLPLLPDPQRPDRRSDGRLARTCARLHITPQRRSGQGQGRVREDLPAVPGLRGPDARGRATVAGAVGAGARRHAAGGALPARAPRSHPRQRPRPAGQPARARHADAAAPGADRRLRHRDLDGAQGHLGPVGPGGGKGGAVDGRRTDDRRAGGGGRAARSSRSPRSRVD